MFIQVQNPTRFMEMPMKTRIALFYEYRIPISILPAMNFFAITKPLSNTGKPRFKGFLFFENKQITQSVDLSDFFHGFSRFM